MQLSVALARQKRQVECRVTRVETKQPLAFTSSGDDRTLKDGREKFISNRSLGLSLNNDAASRLRRKLPKYWTWVAIMFGKPLADSTPRGDTRDSTSPCRSRGLLVPVCVEEVEFLVLLVPGAYQDGVQNHGRRRVPQQWSTLQRLTTMSYSSMLPPTCRLLTTPVFLTSWDVNAICYSDWAPLSGM